MLCIVRVAFRPSLYSLYAIYQPEAEFSKPSPKPAFLQARFPFVRGVLLSKFPLRHSVRQFLLPIKVPRVYLFHHQSDDAGAKIM